MTEIWSTEASSGFAGDIRQFQTWSAPHLLRGIFFCRSVRYRTETHVRRRINIGFAS